MTPSDPSRADLRVSTPSWLVAAAPLAWVACLSNPTPHPAVDAQGGGETTREDDTSLAADVASPQDTGDAAPPFDPDAYPEPEPYPPTIPSTIEVRAALVADLDGDGAGDVIAANAAPAQFGFFIFRGGPRFDLTRFDAYVPTHTRPLAIDVLLADADARLDVASFGSDGAAEDGYLALGLARGDPFAFGAPLLRVMEQGFPQGGAALPDGSPVSVLGRDVTNDGLVDFVIADATRVAVVTPAGTSAQAFAEAPLRPLTAGSAWAGGGAVLTVDAGPDGAQGLVVLERERLAFFGLPLSAEGAVGVTSTGTLPFTGAARIGATPADLGGEVSDLLVFAGDALYAVRVRPDVVVSPMSPLGELVLVDGAYDAIATLDVNDDDAPDALVLDHAELRHLGRSSVTLLLDLYVADGELRTPFAPVRYRFSEGYDPVVMAQGELDGDPSAIEIVTFDVGGDARCLQLARDTLDFGPCP